MSVRWGCKATAARLLEEAEQQTQVLVSKGCQPHLAVILVGEHPASAVYVRNKIKTCHTIGIKSTMIRLPEEVPLETLLEHIHRLNEDGSVHGILVQLPLPAHIDETAIIAVLDPDKDVDGFQPINVGRLSLGEPGLFPCTPMGVMALLADSGTDLVGKHAVVVGRSNIVGKPMAQLLLRAHCTVTTIHSRTKNPQELCRQADIVVVAVGRTGLVDASWLKPGALVVDVGMNQIEDQATAARLIPAGSRKEAAFRRDGKVLYGDVHFADATSVAAKVTPVPGGVGKLTIAQLMKNCVSAAARSIPS